MAEETGASPTGCLLLLRDGPVGSGRSQGQEVVCGAVDWLSTQCPLYPSSVLSLPMRPGAGWVWRNRLSYIFFLGI